MNFFIASTSTSLGKTNLRFVAVKKEDCLKFCRISIIKILPKNPVLSVQYFLGFTAGEIKINFV